MSKFNILFTSAGRRVSLIEHFQKSLNNLGLTGKIITTDLKKNAPASFVADAQMMLGKYPDITIDGWQDGIVTLRYDSTIFITKDMIAFDLDDTLFPEHKFVLSRFQAVNNWTIRRYYVADFFKAAWHFFKEGKYNSIFNLTLEHLKIEYENDLVQELV